MGDLKGALVDTDLAIRDWENNAKALFRQGQVSICNWECFQSLESWELLHMFGASQSICSRKVLSEV